MLLKIFCPIRCQPPLQHCGPSWWGLSLRGKAEHWGTGAEVWAVGQGGHWLAGWWAPEQLLMVPMQVAMVPSKCSKQGRDRPLEKPLEKPLAVPRRGWTLLIGKGTDWSKQMLASWVGFWSPWLCQVFLDSGKVQGILRWSTSSWSSSTQGAWSCYYLLSCIEKFQHFNNEYSLIEQVQACWP